MRQHRNPFHSSEYTDLLADVLHEQTGGKLADWQFAQDRMAGSWYWHNDLHGMCVYASPFWTDENDISLQFSTDEGDCPDYGCIAIDFTPTGDVLRDANVYASLVLPMLAILTQRHIAATVPSYMRGHAESVHDGSFAPVETEEQRLVRQRDDAIAKLTDDQLSDAVKHCTSKIAGELGYVSEKDREMLRVHLAALERAQVDRRVAPFVLTLDTGKPPVVIDIAQGEGASSVLADEFENEAERNITMLDTLGIIDEVCSWAMNEDISDLDDEQLRLAIARVQDVRDRAKLASPEIQQHVAERLEELEDAQRSRADDDEDDEISGDDDDADETFVQELVQMFNNADDDGPFSVEVRRAETFVDADVLTSDAGLRVVFIDGRVYDITVQRGRDER